jgi:hypothetical protein
VERRRLTRERGCRGPRLRDRRRNGSSRHPPLEDRHAAPDRPQQGIKTLVWDRGYSIQEFKSAHGPLIAAGIDAIFDLSKTQREHPPVSEQVLWIDGQPFHLHTPEHLRELERPPMNSAAEVRREYEEKFNERAAWRWSRLARPDRDGGTRWICPFHAGRLKCRSIRQTKVKASAPLVTLPAGVTRCCEGTLQVSAEYLNLAIPYGTSAHSKAYGRRTLVETGNSYFGGSYIDLSRTYSRLMGNTNRKFVLGMLLAGLNRYIERSWRAKQAANAAPVSRRKRRTGTLTELALSPGSPAPARAPRTSQGTRARSRPRPSPKTPARNCATQAPAQQQEPTLVRPTAQRSGPEVLAEGGRWRRHERQTRRRAR